MKVKEEKSSKIKIFIVLIIFVLLSISFVQRNIKKGADIDVITSNNVVNTNLEKFTKNDLYSGVGQVKIEGKDGYDTTFTTSKGKVYKEYKQTGNASWKNKSYWSSTFEENGCGVATLAILASGYNKNYTPEDLRRKYINFAGKHLEGEQMSGEINKTFGLKNSDFVYADVYFKKEYVFNHLREDKPVLICVWNKPDDKWTTTSHYMLLLGTDNENKVYVSNPNGLYGEKKMSGWYNQEEILPYIAKAMFINE